jgi:hypothetical protein
MTNIQIDYEDQYKAMLALAVLLELLNLKEADPLYSCIENEFDDDWGECGGCGSPKCHCMCYDYDRDYDDYKDRADDIELHISESKDPCEIGLASIQTESD